MTAGTGTRRRLLAARLRKTETALQHTNEAIGRLQRGKAWSSSAPAVAPTTAPKPHHVCSHGT